MGTNPMDQEQHEQRKSERLANLRAAQRCLARTRRGTPCQCPAIKAKARCRLHGGAHGAGAPMGKVNGAYRHGGWTKGAIQARRQAAGLLKALQEAAPSC